jgi:hypothetical protein
VAFSSAPVSSKLRGRPRGLAVFRIIWFKTPLQWPSHQYNTN